MCQIRISQNFLRNPRTKLERNLTIAIISYYKVAGRSLLNIRKYLISKLVTTTRLKIEKNIYYNSTRNNTKKSIFILFAYVRSKVRI